MNGRPLDAIHERMGAAWAEGSGGPMPAHYADPAGERDAVRSGCGVVDLSDRGQIRVGGRDRLTFLQGMVSNDTRKLEPGRGQYATVLDPKGHMLGDLTLFAFADDLTADAEPGTAAALIRTLDRYLIREKVTLALEDSTHTRIGLSGPGSGAVLRSLLPEAPDVIAPYACFEATAGGAAVRVMRRDFTGEESYLLSAPNEAAPALWEAAADAGARPFGQEALELLRIEAGIPRFGVDMTPDTIPLEAGIFFGINRDKGCYVGQEVIERISSRGHTNRRLASLRLAPGPVPPSRSTLHRADREVGWITSAALSPALGAPVALGYVRHEACEPGTTLAVRWEGGAAEAEVLARPPFGSGEPPAITLADPTW